MNSDRLKPIARFLLRPLRTGWPDEGRRIVQGPLLRRLLGRIGPARTVLNAGSGEGLFSSLLLTIPEVRQVTEMDFSYRSQRRLPADRRQRIVAASLTAVPASNGVFDLVLCTEVLEHIDDDAAALDELRRVLAPGGWLLITVPTPPAVHDPAHVREGYAPEDLTRMLTARGLEVVETAFCMHAAFKLIMRVWRRYGLMPRASIWCLALADRFWPIGRPMDLMILSQLPANAAHVDVRMTETAHTDAPQSQVA